MARGLGSLAAGDGVLDRMRVEGQLVGKFEQELMIGVAQIEPDKSAFLLQMV